MPPEHVPQTPGTQTKRYRPVSDREIIDRLERSVALLYENDHYLITAGVNERSISPMIAHYLRSFFEEHDVDCEYDMNMEHKKAVDTEAGMVGLRPDVLVHRRGALYPYGLLAVEIKLKGREGNAKRNRDLVKLTSLVRNEEFPRDYRYQVAAFFDLGRDGYDWQHITRANPDERFEHYPVRRRRRAGSALLNS